MGDLLTEEKPDSVAPGQRRHLARQKREAIRSLLEDGAGPVDMGVSGKRSVSAAAATKTLGRLVEDAEGLMDACFEDILGERGGTVVVAVQIIADPDIGAVVDRAKLESGAPPDKEEAMFSVVFEDDVDFAGTLRMSAPFSYVGEPTGSPDVVPVRDATRRRTRR